MLNRDIWQHKNQKYKEQEVTELWLSVLFFEVNITGSAFIKQFLKILLNIDKNNV